MKDIKTREHDRKPKVLEKASEILVRRWDAAHACIVEGRAKQPEL